MTTFEIWASPTSALPKDADHTFVYCRDNGQYFGCWSGGNIKGAVKITYGTLYNPIDPYKVANCYRRPVDGPLGSGSHPDTAGLGIYGVNGVCHQSANLFYYAVLHRPMFPRTVNGIVRPRGFWASYAAYGSYGTTIPGAAWDQDSFLRKWLSTVYNPCYNQQIPQGILPGVTRSSLGGLGGLLDLIKSWWQAFRAGAFFRDLEKLYLEASNQKLPAWGVTAREFGFMAKRFKASVDLSSFEDTHSRLLKEKHDMIAADWKGSQHIGEPLAGTINDWCVTLQKELEAKLGAEAYEKFTGLPSGQQVHVVDPRIASGKS